MPKILAIDYGQKKNGLALADTDTKTALPLGVVSLDKLESKINNLILSEDIEKIVIGLPLGMNGQETAQTKEVRNFIQDLKSTISLEVVSEDERLTSVQAGNVGKDDAVAAMHILQSYLDKNYG